MQHSVYQLTAAKAHAQPTPKDCKPPDPVEPQPAQWTTGSAKRKRNDSSDHSDDEDE